MNGKKKRTSFEEAGNQRQSSVVAEFFGFLKENKKYWLIPIIVTLLGLGFLIFLSGTAAAPFIYTLF